ncbi:MAG: ATP-binding protein [Parvularculales bacterium]
MSDHLSLRLEATMDELARLDAAVEAFSQARGWAPEFEFHIKLMLEELVTNIVSYGYDGDEGGSHAIEVEIDSGAESVTVEVMDNGRAFDPLAEAPLPDLTSSVEERQVGGLGVHLVRTMSDEVRYERKGDKNCLTLVKRRNA